MSKTFAALLTEKGIDSDALMQAARYYLAERTNDLTAEEMQAAMVETAHDPAAVKARLADLAKDATTLETACRALLEWAWNDEGEQARIERALDAAKQKLPVIEVTILSMVALYGAYLMATGGQRRRIVRVKLPDGTERESQTEYFGHPLASLVDLFKGGETKRSGEGQGD